MKYNVLKSFYLTGNLSLLKHKDIKRINMWKMIESM